MVNVFDQKSDNLYVIWLKTQYQMESCPFQEL